MLLYSRKKVRYRRDGYCWKKRKDGKTTREDHMKLKVQGTECIYGCYVHSAILPTFHRRCYWLLQNPDIVLVHYLNVPYPDDNKLAVIAPSVALWGDKKEWTKDELVSQLKPMFYSEDEPDLNNELEISTAETVEAIVSQLMEKQRCARAAALSKTLECGCPDSTCADGKACSHPMRRISAAKTPNMTTVQCKQEVHSGMMTTENNNQVSSTTGSSSMMHHHHRIMSVNQQHHSVQETRTTMFQHQLHHHQQQNHNLHHQALITNPQVSQGHQTSVTTSASSGGAPLVLSLSQIQSSGGLLILNSGNQSHIPTSHAASQHHETNRPQASSATVHHHHQANIVTSFVTCTNQMRAGGGGNGGGGGGNSQLQRTSVDVKPVVPKQEAMEMEVVNSCQVLSAHRLTESITTVSQHQSANSDCRMSHNNRNNTTNTRNNHRQHQDMAASRHTNIPEKMDITNGNVIMDNEYDTGYSRSSTTSKASKTDQQLSPKHMDTSCDLNMDIKTPSTSSSSSSTSSSFANMDGKAEGGGGGGGNHHHNYFNETLDLSQEDIQQTLSANMPMNCGTPEPQHGDRSGHHSSKNSSNDNDVLVSSLNPMDFIDVTVSPPTAVDDDVFVNLEAFDMLGEFPELEGLESSHNETSIIGLTTDKDSSPQDETSTPTPVQYGDDVSNITDYSPEWAYPEGGVKVLVTGPWYSTTSPYTVLFDSCPVPTTLVQSGVLRCYCPAHEVGLASLQVACDNFVISNSVMFEYKLPPKAEESSPPPVKESAANDNLLRFTLLQRLEAIDDKLHIKQEPDVGNDSVGSGRMSKQNSFEDRLVSYCQEMCQRPWRVECHRESIDNSISWFSSHRSMTILHLAAHLGYTRLLRAMLRWRNSNPSLALESEVDALSRDADGSTPLARACASGHCEAAILLYRWNHTALGVRDDKLRTALDCARENEHNRLVEEIERLENERVRNSDALSGISSVDCFVSLIHGSQDSSDKTSDSTEPSVKSRREARVIGDRDDGIFLRPISKNESQHLRFSASPVELEEGAGVGGGGVGGGGGGGGGVNENKMFLSGLDNTRRTQNSTSPGPTAGGTSDRTVNTRSSNNRLFKRQSVDSGIHVESSTPARNSSKSTSTSRDNPKLSRFDRSMSLPLHSPLSGTDSAYDSAMSDSPIRRMDFALFLQGESSLPNLQIDAALNQDSFGQLDMNISDEDQSSNVSGEQEVRVLTLAEQIIAAMPDRIKSFCGHHPQYYDVATPASSLSPASSSCLPSPSPSTFPLPDSPSPPPTTADFCEFFHASTSPFEKDFSNLTLSDREQRELYEAAKIIQKAYRSYKGRKKLEEQDKERAAAVLIQNYYRRYKQYAYFKQMTKAAMVIQHGFRSYCEHKRRFKKNKESAAALRIQNYYRNYREQGGGAMDGGGGGGGGGGRGGDVRTGTESGGMTSSGLKRTYSQRRQHQAARKIQQFMRQSKNNSCIQCLGIRTCNYGCRKSEPETRGHTTHEPRLPCQACSHIKAKAKTFTNSIQQTVDNDSTTPEAKKAACNLTSNILSSFLLSPNDFNELRKLWCHGTP
ncbi:calmodulin-binding transcription activator 2 [Nilaparvata lugens]|uniref:calmodulin-binding transcription activator 2 n=1 Tax=Nilaparvata lugens TaxID=108931 RepID=UPI00193C9A73|nr:calmodulin-binding transcription activator 2 [Nilaparvata lugens]